MNYSTDDIVLAATLKVLACKLVHIEKIGKKGVFHFEGVDANDIKDYEMFRIVVEPQDFNNAIKSLTTASRRLV